MLRWLFPFKSQFDPPRIKLSGKKALIITTSHGTLDKFDKTTGILEKRKKKTGVYASEMTEPYYTFLDADMDVTVASIDGGKIPVDPLSMIYPARTAEDWRFANDAVLQKKVRESVELNEIAISDYDIIFMSGGWGAAYDFAQSELLGQKISQAFAEKKVLASVCHGALGFIGAHKPDGTALVEDVDVTGVTNKQLNNLGISYTPKHPEDELRKLGANYQYKKGFISDLFSNCVVLDKEHLIVSGQNQKSGVEVAYEAMQLFRSISA